MLITVNNVPSQPRITLLSNQQAHLEFGVINGGLRSFWAAYVPAGGRARSGEDILPSGSAQFAVASELCKRGYEISFTTGTTQTGQPIVVRGLRRCLMSQFISKGRDLFLRRGKLGRGAPR